MQCIYCGVEAGNTRDHAIPKLLLRKPYPPNLLTVPSCDKCNGGASKDEEYFRLIIVGLICHTPEAEALFDGPMSRSMNRNIKVEELMFSSLTATEAAVILDVDYPRIFRIAEKIARGLEFATAGVPYSAEHQFDVEFCEVEGPSG